MIKTVFDDKTVELLCAHMVVAEVIELITCFEIALSLYSTVLELFVTVFPLPIFS